MAWTWNEAPCVIPAATVTAEDSVARWTTVRLPARAAMHACRIYRRNYRTWHTLQPHNAHHAHHTSYTAHSTHITHHTHHTPHIIHSTHHTQHASHTTRIHIIHHTSQTNTRATFALRIIHRPIPEPPVIIQSKLIRCNRRTQDCTRYLELVLPDAKSL